MKSAKLPEAEYCESPFPDMLVRVSFHERKNGVYITGVARSRKTHKQILPLIKHTKTIQRGESLDACKRTIVSLVSASYQARVCRDDANANLLDNGENRFVLALQTYMEENNTFPNWAKTTQTQYFKLYNRVFGLLQDVQNNAILTDVDLEPVKDVLRKQVSQSKHSYKSIELNENRVRAIVHHASSVYRIVSAFWNEKYPKKRLPEPQWSMDNPKKSSKEQLKMLDPRTREKFCRELYTLSETQPALVKSAVLMLLNLRTAEAAAVEEKDVQFYDDEEVGSYSVVNVFFQTSDGIQKTPMLKTKQSTRMIPAGFWHTEVLKRCFAALQASGEPGMVGSGDLAEWILERLIAAGCNVENVKPPASELDDVGSLAAYILRRDAASLMKNLMGMASYEIDFLMGHKTKISKAARSDLRLAEQQKKLVAKMNRFCYMDTLTNSPAVTPIRLAHGVELQTIDYHELRLQTPQYATRCELEFKASEPGESISIVCPAELADKLQLRSKKEITMIKPALGCVTKEDDYEKAKD